MSMTQNSTSAFRLLVVALGVAFLVFGLIVVISYVPRSSVEWSETGLLTNLAFIGFGLAVELLGLGLIMLGKK